MKRINCTFAVDIFFSITVTSTITTTTTTCCGGEVHDGSFKI